MPYIDPIDYDTARDLITANHYSKKWNTSFGKLNLGVYTDDGRLEGALVYGWPMNPASVRSVAPRLERRQLLELNRAWLSDEFPHGTESWAIGESIRHMRAHTDVQVVQSFADGRLGVGTIYQASGFDYYGAATTLFFRDELTGEVYHNVPFDNTAVPRNMLHRNLLWIDGRLSPFTTKTYRYLRPLTRFGKRAIALPGPFPFPEYQKGETPVIGYQRPATAIARCELIAARERHPRLPDITHFLDTTYDPAVVEHARAKALQNKWLRDVADAA